MCEQHRPLAAAGDRYVVPADDVGRVLGEAGINISRMQLALVRERNEAAMLVNVDTCPPEPVMEELRNLPHMIAAQLVEL